MSEEHQATSPEVDDQVKEEVRKRRRGCVYRMMALWLGTGAIIVAVMVFVRTRVERDSEAIDRYMSASYEMSLPEGFKPYSMNNMFGTHVVAYWDFSNEREDGRTKNLVSFFWENDWEGKQPADISAKVLANLVDNLARNEFSVKDQRTEEREVDGQAITIHIFTGEAIMDDVAVPAATCFRFMKGAYGPLQVQTLGPTENFPLEQQLETICSIKTR